jgi:hypothetical protein
VPFDCEEDYYSSDERRARGLPTATSDGRGVYQQRRATGEGFTNSDERRVRGDLVKSDA